ncbi:MAG: DUF3822 family protein [Flavobacterium sp.]|uniref:DUF3822 family protein n=1 Tax=Flavobacterium sp. TaxID=239 RepID=UPI00120ABBE9|nr:DUF3822 family protein [Flavobacterium sp.]RZJ66172.1 MAG: DUF3822 family protein [Flavobacterium sp.]
MLVNRPNITEKNYRKLTVRIGQTGFAFCTIDTLNDTVLSMKQVAFAEQQDSNADRQFENAFLQHSELLDKYDEIAVTHENGLNTFVPKALFDENFLGSYLQYDVKVFESDALAFDELPTYEMNNVYVPFATINDFLVNKFGNFDYRHATSVLVSRLLEISKNNDEKQVFAHFGDKRFELVIVQNQKLLLFNSFEYKTKEDFIYYLLFAAEQLSLNPEFFKLQLLGDVTQDSEFYQVAYKYVRNVSLLDVSKLQLRNEFSEADNRKHYILFQS